MRLEKIEIKNFKSLKEISICFEDINIVVGPNGSGKTNLVELFELIKSVYVDQDNNPFLKWWGYDHCVYNRQEELNIEVKFYFKFYSYKIRFSTVFSGQGGKFRFISENIDISDVFSATKEGDRLTYHYDEKYVKNILKDRKYHDLLIQNFGKEFNLNSFIQQGINVKQHKPLSTSIIDLKLISRSSSMGANSIGVTKYVGSYSDLDKNGENEIIEVLPILDKTHHINKINNIFNEFKIEFREFLKFPLLKRLNFKKMRNPFRISNELEIKNDASNIGTILYNLFLKDNIIPETVSYFIEEIFPEMKLLFDLTTDGRVLIKIKENKIQFYPPSLSDGFFKLLTLATLIDLKPDLIIIDEIEDSLYARVIELLLDVISDRKIPVIFTTHSPFVIDIINPKDLIIMKKTKTGSIINKFRDPEKILTELNEMKITLSEKWLYGLDETYLK